LLPQAKRCRQARAKLKARDLYDLTAEARNTTDVFRPYQERTGLSTDDLIHLFNLPNWDRDYGGLKWATIAETLKELASALQTDDMVIARQIGDCVLRLQHNSGPLVPSRANWERCPYLQEKWPKLCDQFDVRE
jgi:hypothetical protein